MGGLHRESHYIKQTLQPYAHCAAVSHWCTWTHTHTLDKHKHVIIVFQQMQIYTKHFCADLALEIS